MEFAQNLFKNPEDSKTYFSPIANSPEEEIIES